MRTYGGPWSARNGCWLRYLLAGFALIGVYYAVPRTGAPRIARVVIYCAIGYVLLRTQLRNHAATGGWSLSGSSLTVVFPTCAIIHYLRGPDGP